ncbi:unnamed protein product [Zymoseptoria tritici ST99CH_3D7]|uniref:Uncharacterized protein n=1 Tax=Zymoseptoria tritici (strain ST99CH_3D7) TaxID=1276538 RepID=A0A1X7S7R7_ZYMT9|nr:unnamed protein product [Zymoseptoria tritici ST99CH_3D7]
MWYHLLTHSKLAGISYDDLLNACADLVSRLAPKYHAIDTCFNGDEWHCTAQAPDQTTPLPNTSGTDVKTQPGRYCYHGVYRVPTPERK